MPQPMVLGVTEAGSGEPLVLVHGFPLDATLWHEQVVGLAPERRVIAVDLRGRGKSLAAPDERWTIDTHADDVTRTLDALGLITVDLAGLSMGGYVAFALVRRHAARLRSLVLVDTKAAADSSEARAGRLATADKVRAEGSRVLVDSMLDKLLAPGASTAARQTTAAMMERTPPETAARDLLAMGDRPDATPLLATIRVPTLVVHGAEDALMPASAARAMAAAIPGARFAAIPGAGHLAPLERPGEVNAVLREFLARQ